MFEKLPKIVVVRGFTSISFKLKTDILPDILPPLAKLVPSKHSSWWSRLEDVFRLRLQKTSSRRLDKDEYIRLSHTSSENVLVMTNNFVLAIHLQGVFKTSLRHLQDVFKTSSRRLPRMSSRKLQDVFKTSSRHLQDIFKTFSKRIIKFLRRTEGPTEGLT